MKLLTIISFLSTLSRSIVVHKPDPYEELKPGDIPTIIYSATGASCEDAQYLELVTRLKLGLKAHVECFATEVMSGIHEQADAACKSLQNNNRFKDEL